MTKEVIADELRTSYKTFTDYVMSLSEEEFMFALQGKWTAGQQLDHLVRSVDPLAKGLMLPKFIIRAVFGKANRSSKTYDELVAKYHAKLAAGGRASGAFIPASVQSSQRALLSKKLLAKVNRLNKNLERFDEKEFDTFILPHPLLGKVTLREMLYFTSYHAQHHLNLIKKYLAERGA